MKKTLTMILAFALVFALGVGGTLAWLTAETTEVKNTFSTSTIGVELKETEATYKMVPGFTVAKDPKAWVTTGSEDAWLFVEITESDNFDTFMTYAVADGWTKYQEGEKVTIICKEVPVAAMGETNASAILKDNQVVVKDTVTKEMMTAEDFTQPTLTFKAYAHQLMKNNETKFTATEAWALIKPVQE